MMPYCRHGVKAEATKLWRVPPSRGLCWSFGRQELFLWGTFLFWTKVNAK